ncbi:MAG: phosphoglucosamine mutase [Ruminococcaceae bacterium]|nr:phosphoglucosamine mutase [Oscillospiraceae bacterium]
MGKLFGTDGVRGVAGRELTADLAYRLGYIAAEVLAGVDGKGGKKKIIIGKDTRISGDMFECAIAAGLTAAGCDVYVAGVVPTPAVPCLIKAYGADMGVMISASHNPYEHNGIKFFNGEGYKLSDEIENKIEEILFEERELPPAVESAVGRVFFSHDMKKSYINSIKAVLAEGKTPSDGQKKRKIAFDLACGSASATAREIFEASDMYGFQPLFLSCEYDGTNINDGCGSTHLEHLSAFVREQGCDMGFAFDGDADRCLAVDENGSTVDGDRIIALIANDMAAKGRLKDNTAVVTCMSNMGFHMMAKEKGLNVKITGVGDRYVLEEMLAGGYNLGGEQSGHIILTDFATTGDGQLTAAVVLGILNAHPEVKASELFACMQTLPQVMINVRVPNEIKKTLSADADVKQAVEEAEAVLGAYGRVLLRPSGTEALVRIMLEGQNEDELKTLAESIKAVIERKI